MISARSLSTPVLVLAGSPGSRIASIVGKAQLGTVATLLPDSTWWAGLAARVSSAPGVERDGARLEEDAGRARSARPLSGGSGWKIRCF